MIEEQGEEAVLQIANYYLQSKVELLAPMAELETYRKTYIVHKPFGWDTASNSQGELRIVLDEVCEAAAGCMEGFHHQIGEVEMTEKVAGGETDEEHRLARQQAVLSMKARLDEFMARHQALFLTTSKPQGKLEAFFQWKKAQQDQEARQELAFV